MNYENLQITNQEEDKNNPEKEFDEEKFLGNLDKISKIDSLSGKEEQMRHFVISVFEKIGIKGEVDKKGNILFKSPYPEGTILLSAHMDRVGKGVEISQKGNLIKGRLDDSVGINLILSLLENGFRPSVLLTVEEESQQEIEENDTIILKNRELPEGIYNAGARFAVEKMSTVNKDERPKMTIVIDVTSAGKVGDGPLVYQSSGVSSEMSFPFPKKHLKELSRLLSSKNISVQFAHGMANDSIEFTFLKNMGVIAIEIPIQNMHSKNETVDMSDIEKTYFLLKEILKNYNNFSADEIDIPLHAQKRTDSIKLSDKKEE